jgi:hypothetical protein
MGEAFSFLLKYSNIHHKSVTWITKWYKFVLLDLKKPTQLTSLKTDERSSQKWPAKLLSSIASLHKNGFDCKIPQHLSFSEPV